MVILASILALTMGAILTVGALCMMLKNASYAQSLCVNETVRMQVDLAQKLKSLTGLNPLAARLREEHKDAERNVIKARSISPELLIVAEAELLAVHLRRVALAGKQKMLLTSAEVLRQMAERRVTSDLTTKVKAVRIRPSRGSAQALAVRPEPPMDITPNYVPMAQFRTQQSESFNFEYPLFPRNFPGAGRFQHWVGPGFCSVSLAERGVRWIPDIVAASASWN